MMCGSPDQTELQNMKIDVKSQCTDRCISQKMFNESEVKIDFNTGKLTVIEESKPIYKVILGLIKKFITNLKQCLTKYEFMFMFSFF